MAKPVPSAPQIAAMNADIAEKTNQQTALTESAALQDSVIASKTIIDTAFKDLFDYYNDDIISKYDNEKKAIDGIFITSPIVEADIIGLAANPPTGRLVPTPPATSPVRIAEFDGGGTDTTTVNEQQHIADQLAAENLLQSGLTGTTPTITATSFTDSAITSASTSIDMIDAIGPMSFSIGDEFIITDGGTDAAAVQVTSVTDNAGGDPPYEFTLGITFIVAPSGTIASGADLNDTFAGFTDSERNTKTATDSDEQPLMDALVTTLQAVLAARQARMTEESAALAANDDPDGISEIETAQIDITTSDSFITTYLISTDISDTGLTSLSTERGTRGGQLTTRLAQIAANYTGQTENYYDQRYTATENRGNTSTGTLREKSNAQTTKDTLTGLSAGLQDSIDALNGIIP